ncbi:MAG: lipase family protein [Lactobacillaceae bacterium]|jgi:hypothetical protein|nr:lipase family protein [Lactobacillaceae bacterium]
MKRYTTQALNEIAYIANYEKFYIKNRVLSIEIKNNKFKNFRIIDYINSDKKALGLEALLLVENSQFLLHKITKQKYKHLIISVRGSVNNLNITQILYDWFLADFGELTALSKPRQSQGLQKWINKILKQYGYSKTKIAITGHSLGGAIVQKIYANHPTLFEQSEIFSSANGYNLLSDDQKIKNNNHEYSNLINYFNPKDIVHNMPPADEYVGIQAKVKFKQPKNMQIKINSKYLYEALDYQHNASSFIFEKNGSIKFKIDNSKPISASQLILKIKNSLL